MKFGFLDPIAMDMAQTDPRTPPRTLDARSDGTLKSLLSMSFPLQKRFFLFFRPNAADMAQTDPKTLTKARDALSGGTLKSLLTMSFPLQKDKKKPFTRDSQRLITRTACPAGRSAATIIIIFDGTQFIESS